ncbi:MAG: hypothetical protein ABI679_05645, partial [Gemmatimonadota bacterium]
MTNSPRWVRWMAAAGAMVAASALAGLVVTAYRATNAELRAADGGIAAAVAGYLSLVTPVEPGGTDYQLPALLSAANTLANAPGWKAGLQVAWKGAPLLDDRIGLTPLEPSAATLLSAGMSATYVRRGEGDIALAPLLDRDRWNSVGWVAVWHSVPSQPISAITLSLGLVTCVATVMAIHLARPGESARRRWTSAAIAVLAMLVLALQLGRRTEIAAVRATNAILVRGRVLAGRARTIPKVSESQLGRIFPRVSATIVPEPPADAIVRLREAGVPSARVEVALRSGKTLRFSMLPREARLGGLWATLFGWVGLMGMGLGFS